MRRDTILQTVEKLQDVEATLREVLSRETVDCIRTRLQSSLAELASAELRLKEASFILLTVEKDEKDENGKQ